MAAKKVLPVPVIALAGWVLPGLGYWLIGQRGRAMVSGITIVLIFLAGIFLGGVRVIDVPGYDIYGQRNVTRLDTGARMWALQSDPVGQIFNKPWYIAQIFSGPMCLIAGYESIEVSREIPQATARIFDIGTLYTAVAGMLNLLVLIDAAHRAAKTHTRPASAGVVS